MKLFCGVCKKCGPSGAKFCPSCGVKLAKAPSPQASQPMLDNRYRIISMVKSGGMGCVFKAYDSRLDTIVAVKKMLLSPQDSQDPQERSYREKKFREEATLLSKLKHGGLPKVIDYFCEEEGSTGAHSHYLVMEFIDGKDFEALIEERKKTPFPRDEALGYFSQIVEILCYLHTLNPPLLYRDLNPRNVMLHEGKVFLVDFGIVKVFAPLQKGTAIGTRGYAAPEQCRGEADRASDVFSLGVFMHYLLTGKDPEESSRRLFHFEPLRSLNPSVPEELDRLIMAMVEVAPQKRPPHAEAVKSLLAAITPPPPCFSPKAFKPISPSASACSRQVPPRKAVSRDFRIGRSLDIFAAIKTGDLEEVKQAVRENPASPALKDKNSWTPLHIACHNGSLEIAAYLIDHGAGVNAKDRHGTTPLHRASEKGHRAIVELLISKGARVDAENAYGSTALKWARRGGHTEVIAILDEALRKKSPITSFVEILPAPSQKKLFARLAREIKSGNLETIKNILTRTPALINEKGGFGLSPLHLACRESAERIVEFLLMNGADVNACDDDGFTPLHLAVIENHRGIVEFLVSHNAEVNAVNREGAPPLHWAKGEIEGVLRARGAGESP
ncbi:MAG: ankyrin repeat domain-containing protein [Candidatus Eremiobacteraeota bacterium]|nr:ankyrin repeat domain-containing protein [Candidatus Eremiobacteraeota bacterium]